MSGSVQIVQGKVWKLGDRCDTGQIIPGKYVVLTDPVELAKHVFEEIRPDLRSKIAAGDVIVGGRNFGCGSSREHAPKSIKYSGISAVVADSFARIFFRNALNIGLLAVPIPGISKETEEGQVLKVDVLKGLVRNESTGKEYAFEPYDDFIMDMLEAGGILPYTLLKAKEAKG